MRFNLARKGLLAAVAGSLMIAGCATPTTYRPAKGSGFSRTGYSERQVTPDRFLVTFAGNSVTERDTVERYLLFRAAELTREPAAAAALAAYSYGFLGGLLGGAAGSTAYRGGR